MTTVTSTNIATPSGRFRIDADIPVEDQVGELKTLRDEGKVRHIGLSEVDVDQLESNTAAAGIELTDDELAALGKAV